MAEEPERNMLFDLRGRRKRVIQVIYVLLAIIMAASLVVIGLPGGVNPFGNTNSANQDVAEANVERAENLQQKLKTQPNNETAAVELIRARFSAPTYPGDLVRLEGWRSGEEVAFRATVPARSVVVLSHGRATCG